MPKGFIDPHADHAAAQQRLRETKTAATHTHGESDEPPGGWDSFFAADIKHDIKCQMCGEMVPEVRPFGPNHESICAACADKDPEMTELRWRALNPNG